MDREGIMGEVTESGEEIVITRNGRPAPRPAPHGKKPNMAFGRNRDKIRILGDIVAPMPAHWFGDGTD